MAERIHEHEEVVSHPFVEEIDFNEIRQLEVCVLFVTIDKPTPNSTSITSSLSILECVYECYQRIISSN